VAWSQAVSPLPAIGLGAVLLARRGGGGGENPGVAAVLRGAFPLAVNGALQMLSPRVELLVLSLVAGDRATGVFLAALRVLEFLGMVPSALAQGAMPSLVREALEGGESVRRRTAATMALLGAPAAAGLALVAVGTVSLLYGPGYADAAVPLALLALALPALFLNALVSWSLLARGRASWLPRLTLARVGVALALALVLVPRLGAPGAAAGLAAAEWLLLVAGAAACRRAEFALPVAGPLALGVAASVPMALVVGGLRESLLLAVPIGVLTWGATLAAVRAAGGGPR
jgi:O-antigen/teichoic acid export membrane protein